MFLVCLRFSTVFKNQNQKLLLQVGRFPGKKRYNNDSSCDVILMEKNNDRQTEKTQ